MRSAVSFVIALTAGTLFGLGLVISGMTDPRKVLGFLDLFGQWDASLAFVMGGGLLIYLPGYYWLAKQRHQPWCASQFHLPQNRKIDTKLIVGAGLFGLGWGVGGFCPGPAVTSLAGGSSTIVIFVVSMLVGLKLANLLSARLIRSWPK